MASTSPIKAIVERLIERKKAEGIDILKPKPKPKAEKKPRKRKMN